MRNAINFFITITVIILFAIIILKR